MASLILKWLRRCLFICICAVFLMSHNASAIISDEVQYYGGGQATFQLTPNNTGMTCISRCVWSMNSNADITVGINYLGVNVPNGTYQNDTIFRYDFVFWKVSNSASLHMIWNNLTLRSPYNQWWSIYNVDFQQLDTNTSKVSIYLHVNNNNFVVNNNNNFVEFYSGLDGSFIFALNPQDRMSGGYWTQWATSSTAVDTQSIVNAINSQPNYQQSLNTINNNINNVNNSINNINDDVEDATQDAADQAADSGDQSSADAENATAGLTSVIGGFVSAITSAQPTNCKINGKINNSFNMGQLDLCSMPVPSFVQIISSLILIAICIPFAIVMFNRFIGLFRSFQG